MNNQRILDIYVINNKKNKKQNDNAYCFINNQESIKIKSHI